MTLESFLNSLPDNGSQFWRDWATMCQSHEGARVLSVLAGFRHPLATPDLGPNILFITGQKDIINTLFRFSAARVEITDLTKTI